MFVVINRITQLFYFDNNLHKKYSPDFSKL
nr:MAG TPA: hypothetical protein [Bacteriophage sp.]